MQLHAGMYRAFHPAVSKLVAIFPFIEASRPRSKSGIQALCSLHVALDKAKGLLQHCADCSRLYLVSLCYQHPHKVLQKIRAIGIIKNVICLNILFIFRP
jgi:hypothetical protein